MLRATIFRNPAAIARLLCLIGLIGWDPLQARAQVFTSVIALKGPMRGWYLQVPGGTTGSVSVVNNVIRLKLDIAMIAQFADIRLVREYGPMDVRGVMDLSFRNLNAHPWRGFLMSLVQPVTLLPIPLENQTQTGTPFIHRQYAHFHPCETVPETSGGFTNQTLWGPCFQGARSFQPLDPTGWFRYDATIPVGPPTGFYVGWDLSSNSPAAVISGLRFHLISPPNQDFAGAGFGSVNPDYNITLRITPDFADGGPYP